MPVTQADGHLWYQQNNNRSIVLLCGEVKGSIFTFSNMFVFLYFLEDWPKYFNQSQVVSGRRPPLGSLITTLFLLTEIEGMKKKCYQIMKIDGSRQMKRHKKQLEKPVINYVPLMSVPMCFLLKLVPISRRTVEI